MEREKDGRYIGEAIVFGLFVLFGFEEIVVCGLEVENCLVDGCLALKTVDCSDGEKDIVRRGGTRDVLIPDQTIVCYLKPLW